MTKLDSIFKSSGITLPTKVHLVKAMIFPVVMCGCENWTVEKAKCQRIDTFELWCWRRLLRVPWTTRSVLGVFLEGMMLKLKLQYFGHLMRRVDSLEKTLMLGGIGGRRRRGWQRMRWLNGVNDSMDLSLRDLLGVGDGQGGLVCCNSWGCKVSDMTEWLNWTEREVFLQLFSQAYVSINSVQFSCSVVSDSLRPHGLQHTSYPCPSPTPRTCSNSCPSSWWCHSTILSSVVPFSSCLKSLPASGSFPMSQSFSTLR